MSVAAAVPDPVAAWRRGGLYAAVVLLLTAVVGALPPAGHTWLPSSDVATWSGVLLVVVVGVLYGTVWARGTSSFGRLPVPGWSALFGVLWGLAAAGVVLSVWVAAGALLDGVARIGAAFLLASVWQGVWHSRYWDVHVSPEHNLPEHDLVKVLLVHTPNLVLSLLYLDRARAVVPVIAAQVVAIVVSCLVMRFPAPRRQTIASPT